VRRFKGLEATLVIIVDVDFTRAVNEEWRRRLYVACSRARHAVHIVTITKEPDLGEALRAFAGTSKVRPSWRALSRHLGVRLAGGNLDPFD
jgi:superfamily I DNA and RNA helicase